MTFPFESLAGSQREIGLLVAVLIGIAFGFVLERAGFGRAPKLAAQFYLRDMTVFKVMFTAIVTAMAGLVIAAGFGLADLRAISESIASWTWIWPMLIGGLILGAGFIISGYCPGTSLVAASSGNVDGVVAFAGVVVGTFIYSELLTFRAFERFHNSGERGAWFLYDLVPVAPELLAFAIALMALLAFAGAEKVERWVSGDAARVVSRRRRFAFATVTALAVAAAFTIVVPDAAVAKDDATGPGMRAPELARRIVDEPWSVRIVDVRDAEAFARGRVPGSEAAQGGALAAIAEETRRSGRDLVVIDAAAYRAWQTYALTPPLPPSASSSEAERAEFLFRASLHQSLSGARAAAPPPIPKGGGVAKPKKRGGGCSS